MLSPNQHKTYQFIKQFIQKQGYSPSLLEIAHGIGVKSKSLISRYIHALEQAGYIELAKGKRRHIRLKSESTGIPLLGHIAAGSPIEAISDNDVIDVLQLLQHTQKSDHYALKVKGDSMIDEGILDGDIILCQRRNFAYAGEIVIALIDKQEATLKRIDYEKDGSIILIPANKLYQPQTYPAACVNIQGVFVGLLRLAI